MQKILIVVLMAVTATWAVQLKCNVNDISSLTTEWLDMKGSQCLKKMRSQIQKEFAASHQYLQMGAHFSRDTINRPGFAEFFFKAAKEEREHGTKLIEYLLMRGELVKDVSTLLKKDDSIVKTLDLTKQWESGVQALKAALDLEISVTKSIRELIKTCETDYNYYHLVDYLTGVYLEEQLHGQRELAGKISTLQKMMATQGALGEFLFDKNNM